MNVDLSNIAALLPQLEIARQEFEAARQRWHDAINVAQSECSHSVWICQDGHSGTWFNHPSIQICAQCRAEVQTGTFDGWSEYEWRRPKFMKLAISPRQAGNESITGLRLRDDPRGFQSAKAIAAATGTAKTAKPVECEASQSGGKAASPNNPLPSSTLDMD